MRFAVNVEKFLERFPKYALLAPQWEAKELLPIDLTKWQKDLDLKNIEILYVFGLDKSVYDFLYDWLHENVERRIVFLEEDTGVIAAIFDLETTLFEDPQIDFECLPPGKNADFLMQELAERYPVKNIEAVALPGKKNNRFHRLRMLLFRKTTLSHALFLDRMHGYQPFENFARNVAHLRRAFYGNGLRGVFANIPAIVCGAGPSLTKAIPLLKELDGRAIVIAGGSTIAALSSAGFDPHFGVAIDPNLEEYRRFRNSFSFECPLLISTRVCPAIFNTCNGPFGYLRSGIGGAPELWLEEELRLLEPLVGEHLSEESISVTAIAIAFAQYIGCGPILLSGVDLAYTEGKRYALGVSDEKESLKAIDAEKSASDRILRRKDKQGRSLYTAVRWLMEAASISHFAKKHPEIRWINTTEGGLSIAGLEEMSLEKAALMYLKQQWDLRGKVAQQIALHPLAAINEGLLEQLNESLIKTIDHLEILSGLKKGSTALAEYEIKEELAASILFYDMGKVLTQAFSRKNGEKEDAKWTLYLKIARKYAEILKPFVNHPQQ